MDDVDKAQAIFSQVAAADAASPDANAGLARIAQSKKDYKDAIDLWSRVESVAAESDPLFYEAKYSMAEILAVKEPRERVQQAHGHAQRTSEPRVARDEGAMGRVAAQALREPFGRLRC